MAYKVAVVGATGNVGREMLSVLAERQFPASEVVALASTRSIGTDVSFGDAILKVKALDYFDFKGTDICLMSAGSSVSKEWSPKIAAAGRDRDRQFLALAHGPRGAAGRAGGQRRCARATIKKGIIANPNCSTAQLVVALKPLHDAAKIKRVVVSTYQSVSGAGKEAMDELFRQTRAVFVADPIEKEKFTKQIAFNVIPHIDVFLDSGYTKEEWKMMVETQKILDPDIQVTATCVRVPVFVGHSEVGQYRVRDARSPPTGRAPSCARRPACWWSTSARTTATSRRSKPRARTRPMSAASARIRRWRTGFRCGWCRTICARARP